MKTFLLIILGLVYAASGQNVTCPGSYRAVGNGCYHFPDTVATWVDASTICQFSGGYLANMDSAAEQSALKVYHYEHFNTISYRWLGATDSLSDGIWRWVPSGATVKYTNWYDGQPSTGDTSNCAVWTPVSGYWSTTTCCDFKTYPLCETLPL